MIELKPCDHCGEDDGVVIWKHERGFIVECGECGASSGVYPTKEKAAKVWNTRPAEDAKDREIERLKKQVADREDEGYAGFVIGVDRMKKILAEKDKEIEKLKAEVRKLATELNNINILADNIMNNANFGSKVTKAEMHCRLTSIYVCASHIRRALARTDYTPDTGKMEEN